MSKSNINGGRLIEIPRLLCVENIMEYQEISDKIKFWEFDKFNLKMTLQSIESPELKRRKETVEILKPMVHPLLIDHIIENVLSCCDDFCESVRTFRLVCKDWNRIATKEFRTEIGRMSFENDFSRNTASFIKVMKKSQDFLFDKFKFVGGFVLYKAYNGHYNFDQVFNELFRICVPWMKSLEFTSHNPSDLKLPKYFKPLDLSGLQSLTFHVCVFYEHLQFEMPGFLETILNAAPNLTKFDFRITTVDPSMKNNAQLELINKFGDIVSTQVPKQVKHVKLNMLITEEQLVKFQQQNLRLESLIVDFQKGPLSVESFEQFLASQSGSLEYLELVEAPISQEMNFPVLSNLKHLRVEGKPVLPACEFGKVLPKIKSLEVLFYWIYQEDNWLKDVFVDNGSSKTVTECDFLCEIADSDVPALFRIARSFPNMKRLSVVIDSLAALAAIFSTMTFLEELEMSLAKEFWKWQGRGDIDEAFTGVPAAHCVFLFEENSFDYTDIPCTLRRPSLRDLKHLKRLKIRAFHPEKVQLTDVTVHFGLLKMEKLEELTLDVFPITKQCLRVLEQKVHLKLLPGPPTLP